MTMLKLVDQIPTSAGSMTPPAGPLSALSTEQQGATGAVGCIGLTPGSGWMGQYPVIALVGSLIGISSTTGDAYRSSMAYTTPGGTYVFRSESAALGHRFQELKFQESHPEVFQPFVGEWVILEGESIIAHGSDPVRVVADARSQGVRVPYVFYVEEPKDDSVWIGL